MIVPTELEDEQVVIAGLMNDEECLDYVAILENLLDAETVDSEYTEEFLQAQQLQYQEEQTQVEQQTEIKGD